MISNTDMEIDSNEVIERNQVGFTSEDNEELNSLLDLTEQAEKLFSNWPYDINLVIDETCPVKPQINFAGQAYKLKNKSVITRRQKKHFRTEYTDDNGDICVLVATVRYDDECKNGHNTFAITGELYDRAERIPGEAKTKHSSGKTLWLGSCGCLHDDIAKHFPELAPYIKWHLVSSDAPMYYIENSMYHAKVKANLSAARSCAVWPDAQLEDFTKEKLAARIPTLMKEFKLDVEKLGFTY